MEDEKKDLVELTQEPLDIGAISASVTARGVYSSLFRYNHIDKKLPFLADFIKN